MTKNLQSKNLIENINQARQKILDTEMQTLQQQESDFKAVLKTVQSDLNSDFSQVSQELIQSYEQQSEKTLQTILETVSSLQDSMKTSLSISQNEIMTKNKTLSEQLQQSQESLLILQSHESDLIAVLDERNREMIDQALTVLLDENQKYRRRFKTLATLPTLVMICLTLLIIFSLVADFTLIQRLEMWKTFSSIFLMVITLAIIVFLTWAWVIHSRRNKDE